MLSYLRLFGLSSLTKEGFGVLIGGGGKLNKYGGGPLIGGIGELFAGGVMVELEGTVQSL